MTEMTQPERQIGRSITAVVVGFLAVAVLSTIGDTVMHAAGIFPKGVPLSNALFVLAAAYRIAFTVLGGFITAKLAPNRPDRHVLILGAIGTLFAIAGTVATWNRGPEFGPHWYPIALVVTALPSVLLGERLARRSRTGSETVHGTT